jgi:hypothetical protein
VNRYIYQSNSAAASDKVVSKQNRLAAMKQLSEALDLNVLCDRLSHIDVQKIKDEDGDVDKFVLEQMEKMREKKLTPEQFDNSRIFLD